MRSGDDTFRGGKRKDSENTTLKGKNKRSKGGNSIKSSKGGKGKSSGKINFKGKGDPLKQRLVSRVDCVVKTVTGRKIVLKLMSTCLKPKAVLFFFQTSCWCRCISSLRC